MNKIDGVTMKGLQKHYTKTKTAISKEVGKISSSIAKQQQTLKQYLKATQSKKYFIYQSTYRVSQKKLFDV